MAIVILIVAIVFLVLWIKFRKIPKFGNMVLVTGGIKTGKSTMTIYLAYRQYKRQLRKYYLWNYFFYYIVRKLPGKRFKNKKKKEKPLFYSNIPIAVSGYVPLTHDLIRREARFRYGSVCYICEASLIADSMCIRDSKLNEQMLLLNKLFAHETRGGYIFWDTQSIQDCHFSVKRCLSTYFYIHHLNKRWPFFMVAWVRELKYSDDNSTINTFDADVEESLKMVIIPKKVWRMFDCYCFSYFTDKCPIEDREKLVVPFSDMKAKKIVSFKRYETLDKEFIENEERKSEEKT